MTEFVDPYLDPSSNVLRNRIGITDPGLLDRAEAQLVEARAMELDVRVTGDLRQLRAVHRHLFQDVYDWAGELRTVDIRKGSDAQAEFFMPVARIPSGAGFAFAELGAENNLRGLERDQFISRLAHHYDQVNYLHPFREGNGRTQRIFWDQIATRAGYTLNWERITADINNQACRDAMERRDFTGLQSMFDTITSTRTVNAKPLSAEHQRLKVTLARDFPIEATNPAHGADRPPQASSTRAPGAERGYGTEREQ